MIKIKKSATADSRSCDYSKVTSDQLRESSIQHIQDVCEGMYFLIEKMKTAAYHHDMDKIKTLEQFHACMVGGFQDRTWLDGHYVQNRHHLLGRPGTIRSSNGSASSQHTSAGCRTKYYETPGE
jgi:hypothetical protein